MGGNYTYLVILKYIYHKFYGTREARSLSANQIPRLSRNPSVHYRTYESVPLSSPQSQMNQAYASSFTKIYFNITNKPVLKSPH